MKTSDLEKQFLSIWQRRHLLADAPDWVAELPEPVHNYKFHPTRRWLMDWAWPAYRVAVEIDGGVYMVKPGRKAHASGPGIDKDNQKRNAARERDWRVFQFTARDLIGRRIITTIKSVANALGKGKVADVDEQLELFN